MILCRLRLRSRDFEAKMNPVATRLSVAGIVAHARFVYEAADRPVRELRIAIWDMCKTPLVYWYLDYPNLSLHRSGPLVYWYLACPNLFLPRSGPILATGLSHNFA